jgi:Peptidase family M1 domain
MSLVSKTLKGAGILALMAAGILFQINLSASPEARQPASTVPVLTADDIPLASPNAAAVTVPSAANAWGGPRTGKESTLSDRVVHYQISAKLDPVKHTIDGQQKLTWRNRSQREVRSVYIHLYLNAFEGSYSTFYTEKRNWNMSFRSEVDSTDGEWGHIELRQVTQGGAKVPWRFVQPDGGPKTDHTVVRLDLPTPVAAGASTTLDINFHDQLPRVVARTGYFGSFHLVGQWFPKIAVLELPGERGATTERWNAHEMHMHSEFYADYGSFDVSLTVPKGYTVGATGEEQGAPQEKDGMVTHRYVQADVHDFAWTADNRGTKVLEDETNEPGVPRVKIKVLSPPEYAHTAAAVMKATKDSIAYFSKTLGPYPYRTTTAVIPPFNAAEAGGMEYPTFFTVTGNRHLTPHTMSEYGLDFVTIHEFGHDYFYGILGSNEFEEPMLDEGLNQYWDNRMLRHRKQDIHLANRFTKAIGLGVKAESFAANRLGAAVVEPFDPTGQNSWNRSSSAGFGTVYSRTATLMRDLEAQLTTPVMERAFKQYYETWKFRHPSIADLRESLAQSSGQRAIVEKVFAQNVYQVNKIDDRVAKFTSKQEKPEPGTREVNGKWVEDTADQLEQKIDAEEKRWKKSHPNAKPGLGPYPWRTVVMLKRYGASVPQTVLVKFADGSQEKVIWDNDEKWQRLVWLKPSRAVSVELDPERLHYLDANKLDDSRTLKANLKPSRRWSSEVSVLAQAFIALLVNI